MIDFSINFANDAFTPADLSYGKNFFWACRVCFGENGKTCLRNIWNMSFSVSSWYGNMRKRWTSRRSRDVYLFRTSVSSDFKQNWNFRPEEKKRNFLDNLTSGKADRPVFCVIGKIWCFVRSHFRPHQKCSVTIFMYAHGKLDLTFDQAMPKLSCSAVTERRTPSLTEMCTHLSRNRGENINHEFWIKTFV